MNTELEKSETDLLALYNKLTGGELDGKDQWDHPFMSGRGLRYDDSSPKILIVGKATAGWSHVPDTNSRKSVRKRSGDFLEEIKDSPPSAFWRHVQRLAGDIAAKLDRNWPTPIEHVAWSNLARIGYARGAPEGFAFDIQRTVCQRLLAEEIRWLQPSIIILLTHNYQHDFVSDLFSGTKWKDLAGCGHKDAWVGESEDFLIIWTAHPERKTTVRLEAESSSIASTFARWTAERLT